MTQRAVVVAEVWNMPHSAKLKLYETSTLYSTTPFLFSFTSLLESFILLCNIYHPNTLYLNHLRPPPPYRNITWSGRPLTLTAAEPLSQRLWDGFLLGCLQCRLRGEKRPVLHSQPVPEFRVQIRFGLCGSFVSSGRSAGVEYQIVPMYPWDRAEA